jgi:signal transduction histidine kinase
MKLSHLILLGFMIILVMFASATYINYNQAERVNENSEYFTYSTQVVRIANRFQRNILSMISGLRGYAFTGENHFIQSYDSAAAENVAILKELSAAVASNPAQNKSLNEIINLNDHWLKEFAEPIIEGRRNANKSDSSQTAFNALYRQKLMSGTEMLFNRRLQQKVRDFSNYEYNLREQRKAELTSSIRRTRQISFYLTTFSIVIGLAIAIFLANRISTRMLKMVQMADDIAAGNYNVYNPDEGRDELGRLTRALNHMAKVLSENIALLQRKNEELGQFAHIVSHDLKAPLRGIDNVVTWIEEDHTQELSPKVKEYIQLIKGRLTRAENLIQGILLYARVGREMPVRENVDLNEMIQEVLENVAPEVSQRVEVQNGLPTIFTERIPLEQVFSNLISNAIKYHDKEDGFVRISFRDTDLQYKFFVEDNGPGIDRIYHDKIFMIFQTLHERDVAESTGVGLAIVKKILEDRKQTIKVISTPGKGSTFVFTWPKQHLSYTTS